MKKLQLVLACALAVFFITSCKTYTHNMKDSNAYVEFHANDFTLSNLVVGEATVTKILGLDFARLFGKSEIGETAGVGTVIPYIGMTIPSGANYALYDLMQKNPGYDVVIYPQVESQRNAPILGTDIYSTTKYKVSARLGKLK